MCRLRQIPRAAEGSAPAGDPGQAQIFAALSAAHAQLRAEPDAELMVAWHRPRHGAPLRVLLGGRPWCPPMGHATGATGVPVAYPPGAIGDHVDAGTVRESFNTLGAWVRCTAAIDPLWAADPQAGADPPRRGGFDDYVAHLRAPFVWLVLARPLQTAQVQQELDELEADIPSLRLRDNSEQSRVQLLRAEARYRELTRAIPTGVWEVSVLVGADSTDEVRRAAALLCGASDLKSQPYLLVPGDDVTDLTTAAKPPSAEPDHPSPSRPRHGTGPLIRGTTELLAAIARPPRRELPGIRLVERADFDLTSDHGHEHRDEARILLGDILDEADQTVGEFTVSAATINRHVLTTGATGSGKSQTIRHLLEQLHRHDVPWLVIEPAKSEYAGMAGRIGNDQIVILRPGDPDAVPCGLNPLQPEPGFPLQTHIDLVRALFLAAFEPAEPFPQVLSQALDRCYRDLGWDPATNDSRLPGVTPRYPRLADLHRTALTVVEGIGYGKDISDNVRGFVDVRLRSLRLGTPGRFLDGHYPLSVEDLLQRNVVLEIEDIGEDTDKAFLMGALFIRIVEHLRVRHTRNPRPGLRHVTVIEEAHRLLRRALPGSPTAHAVETFTALLAEIRAYGEGIVVAEQIPDKIVPDVIKNTALKIVHRLPGADDRDAVGATMNLEPAQSRHIVSLPAGRAAVFADGMDRPIRITVPYGETRETPPRAARQVALDRADTGPVLTARQLAETERIAADPELALWIELLTTAHLTGQRAPSPRQAWCAQLRARAPHDMIDHAITHRINAAIDARYTGLAEFFQPEHLAAHLKEVALRVIHHQAPLCTQAEFTWQAGPYRWIDVHRALKTFTGDGQHPDTATWATRGLHLPGPTRDEQQAQLLAHRARHRSPSTTVTGEAPCAYHHALHQLSDAPEHRQRLRDAAAHLHLETLWPAEVFLSEQPTTT
ncbi:ATP-binding protein [Amycolatopsis lurida]|uniref:ATP-binding protein n=1 Tax=Amycolatopsis lurida TaxID=31959 RepID=UPI00364FEAEC